MPASPGRKTTITLGAVAAMLVAVQAVRVAAVEGLGGEVMADLLWPDHPRRVIDRELSAIGVAAGRREAPSAGTLSRINAVALRDPLAAQPFLVAGTAALASEQRDRSALLLKAAVRHDPRDPSARLLLANLLLEQGELEAGMLHVATLSRILPGGAQPLAPALAAFVRQPDNARRLAPLLNQDADLRDKVLQELAADPDNAGAVLRLAGAIAPPSAGLPPPGWQGRMVKALVTARRFDEARGLWTRFTGQRVSSTTLTDPGFGDRGASPPFGWTLTSGPNGSAEPDGQSGLQVQYYGRDNVELANQLATLPTGNFRLSLRASGSGDNLGWSVTCIGAKAPLFTLGLGGRGERIVATTFRVPETCPAQTFALNGTSPEFPSTSALQINAFRLERLPG